MPDLFSYSNKRVVVTGGASGVGAALVELLDHLGEPEVIVLDVREPSALSSSQRWMPTDLTSLDALARAVDEVGPVDVLFNNAGVAGTATPETVLAVNLLALRYLTNAIGERMRPGGAVVNTSSTAGGRWGDRLAAIGELLDMDDWDDALAWFHARHDELGVDRYSFSKECVQVFTMRLAVPFARRGLRINSVCPSPIDTPLLSEFRTTFSDKVIDFSVDASGGLATPADIAQVLAFLGMDAARQVNGVNLLADGGSTAGFATGTSDTSALRPSA
jgi:NAD(P)-dependent dehydrogenase (short-subunit alcohol dehydrogenase family)